MNLSKEQLLQIVREETLAEIGVRDALMGLGKAAVSGGKKLYRKGKEAVSIPTHTGGRVTRGGSQGQRAQDASVLGVDASETPAEAAGALAAETPYGPEHSIHTATRSARGGGRVTAGGSGGERAKAAERLGVDPSQDPVDVDPWTFPGGPGEVRPYSYADLPGKPQRGHRGRGEPNEYGDVEIGEADYDYLDYGAPAKESLTRSRLRQAVMEELSDLRGEKILDEKKKKDKDWIQKAVDPEHKGYCTPMTKKTCTPKRKALAKRFKKAARKEKKKGGTGWEGKV
jgi:hypothetical protein